MIGLISGRRKPRCAGAIEFSDTTGAMPRDRTSASAGKVTTRCEAPMSSGVYAPGVLGYRKSPRWFTVGVPMHHAGTRVCVTGRAPSTLITIDPTTGVGTAVDWVPLHCFAISSDGTFFGVSNSFLASQ